MDMGKIFGGKPPEKPDGDRETLTFTALDVELETAVEKEADMVKATEPGGGHADPDDVRNFIQKGSEAEIQMFWDNWMDVLFSHRFRPEPLFDTGVVEKQGIEAHVVREDEHGRDDRPVLKRSKLAKDHILHSAKTVCLQYAISADVEPREAAEQIPFDLFPTEIWRLREFVEENDLVWCRHKERPWWDRSPMGTDHQLNGIVYFMYTLDGHSIEPRYIGLSQRNDVSGEGLNYGFANATSDSVFTRWGYGKSQHLGELSAAMWPDESRWDPEPKYNRWVDELFLDRTRVLKKPVYIEVLPWMSDSPVMGEENLVMLASKLYSDELLNVEYADEWADGIQTEL